MLPIQTLIFWNSSRLRVLKDSTFLHQHRKGNSPSSCLSWEFKCLCRWSGSRFMEVLKNILISLCLCLTWLFLKILKISSWVMAFDQKCGTIASRTAASRFPFLELSFLVTRDIFSFWSHFCWDLQMPLTPAEREKRQVLFFSFSRRGSRQRGWGWGWELGDTRESQSALSEVPDSLV